jgi:hypothetical protein
MELGIRKKEVPFKKPQKSKIKIGERSNKKGRKLPIRTVIIE